MYKDVNASVRDFYMNKRIHDIHNGFEKAAIIAIANKFAKNAGLDSYSVKDYMAKNLGLYHSSEEVAIASINIRFGSLFRNKKQFDKSIESYSAGIEIVDFLKKNDHDRVVLIGLLTRRSNAYISNSDFCAAANDLLKALGEIRCFSIKKYFFMIFYDLISRYFDRPPLVSDADIDFLLAEIHLEMVRLILAIEVDPTQYPEATPDREQRTLPPEIADPDEPGILTLAGHINEAERLINDTGYHRRDAELAELKQQAGIS